MPLRSKSMEQKRHEEVMKVLEELSEQVKRIADVSTTAPSSHQKAA